MMNKKIVSLRSKFLARILTVLIAVALFSGFIQIFMIKKQIIEDMDEDAAILAHSIEHGITELDLPGKKKGIESWIEKLYEENHNVKEIAVLETQSGAPSNKIIYGTYNDQNEQDIEFIKSIMKEAKETAYIQRDSGREIYKIFFPINESQLIYIAFDYKKMIAPLYRHSVILIVSGFVSLLALFLLAVGFFNKIHENIQRIKTQIKLLDDGKLTAKSDVKDGSELELLSESTNRMAETLRQVLTNTVDQAIKVQRLSVMLEAEASQSVEKMYVLSMETTAKSREKFEEVFHYLDTLEEYLKSQIHHEKAQQLLQKTGTMRQIANGWTATTTNMTFTLSDLIKSLHGQSGELAEISSNLLQHMARFKLESEE